MLPEQVSTAALPSVAILPQQVSTAALPQQLCHSSSASPPPTSVVVEGWGGEQHPKTKHRCSRGPGTTTEALRGHDENEKPWLQQCSHSSFATAAQPSPPDSEQGIQGIDCWFIPFIPCAYVNYQHGSHSFWEVLGACVGSVGLGLALGWLQGWC